MSDRLLARLPHIAYGGDYNPDQWPEEVWREDVRLMQEAGVNLVSVGIFSWSRLQPGPETFDFEWLDRVMDLLHEGGISVDLATATASPPPWLVRLHPEMLPVNADGVRLWHGARQHYCPSSPAYREAARTLAQAMAERYAKHPALTLWHINNEYGCHVPACWCDVSAEAFRAWLRARYGTVDALNEAWGTDFWSQRYTAWDEVIPPRRTPTWPNPSQQLDFMRFSSDELLACYELEVEVVREASPDVPITTNFMGFFKPVDYWKWAEREDVVSNDAYPDPADPGSPMRAAMTGDLMRSLGRGRPWILMEQTPSRVNWREVNVAKSPGQMRLWSYQAIARGADGVMFFQWRQSRAGAEKFHSAVVPHGVPSASPVWREAAQLGRELAQLDAICGATSEPRVGILFDWESWWALELPSKPSTRIRQVEQVEAFYRPLFEANVAVDFIRPGDDLSGYRLVIAPGLYLVTDDAAASIVDFVRRGGSLVMSFFSGIVDPNEHIRLGGYPQPFGQALGLEVIDWHPLSDGALLDIQFGDGRRGRGSLWSEVLELRGAGVAAVFEGAELDGQPAITTHRFGEGTALYLATLPDAEALKRLIDDACAQAGVTPAAEVPSGVEAVRRSSARTSFVFLLNHREVAVDVPIAQEGVNLIDGGAVHRGLLRLEPRGVAVIREGW